MANPSELIKTVTDLPWDGILKLLIVGTMALFLGAEYFEDSADDSQSAQGDDQYILLRDLSVSQITALEALRASIQGQEVRQDVKIDELKEFH